MVALINAYTSVMTALLTVPKLEPIANTLEEAVIQNRCVTMETNTPVSRDVLVRLLLKIKHLFQEFKITLIRKTIMKKGSQRRIRDENW